MAAVRPFLFDRRFDRPEPAEDAGSSLAPAAKCYDEDDLARVRAEALAAGREAGLKEGRAAALAEAGASDQRRLALACDAIAVRLARLVQAAEQARQEARDDTVAIAVAIARKLLPEYCRRHGAGEIEAVIRAVIDQLGGERRLVIRVAAPAAAGVRETVAAIAEGCGFAGELVVRAEDGIAAGDCVLEWSDGGVRRDAGELWAHIDHLVARALAPAGAEAAGDDSAADGG